MVTNSWYGAVNCLVAMVINVGYRDVFEKKCGLAGAIVTGLTLVCGRIYMEYLQEFMCEVGAHY